MAAKSNSKPKATKAVEVEPTEVEVNETVTVEESEVVEATVEEKVEEVVVEVVIEEPKVEAVSVKKEFTSVDKVIDNKKPVSIGYGYVHTWNGMEY